MLASSRCQCIYTVDTIASNRQVVFRPLQKQLDGHDKPIGYQWGSLTDVDHAYDTV